MFLCCSFGRIDCRYCNSGRKLDVPVCEILPVATVTELGIVLACMKDLTSGRLISGGSLQLAVRSAYQAHTRGRSIDRIRCLSGLKLITDMVSRSAHKASNASIL